MRLIAGSTGSGPIGDVQNHDRRDFIANSSTTPLMSVYSRLDLNTTENRIVETSNEEDFEDGHFPASRPSYDRRIHTHHMVTGHKAPHNSIPEYLTGRIQTQYDPLSQEFTQPQNMATHISPDNTLPMG